MGTFCMGRILKVVEKYGGKKIADQSEVAKSKETRMTNCEERQRRQACQHILGGISMIVS